MAYHEGGADRFTFWIAGIGYAHLSGISGVGYAKNIPVARSRMMERVF